MSLLVHAASAPEGELLIFLLEITHPTWAAPLRFAEDVQDWVVTLEDDFEATFLAGSFEGDAGSSDDSGVDERRFRVADEDLVLWRLIEAVIGHATPIRVKLRLYLSTDVTEPLGVVTLDLAEPRLELDRSVSFSATTANTTNRGAPTSRYTLQNSPGLRR